MGVVSRMVLLAEGREIRQSRARQKTRTTMITLGHRLSRGVQRKYLLWTKYKKLLAIILNSSFQSLS